ncbi:MAG: hypothetical protein ACREFI_05770, partial [Stellaceae bacterium]
VSDLDVYKRTIIALTRASARLDCAKTDSPEVVGAIVGARALVVEALSGLDELARRIGTGE